MNEKRWSPQRAVIYPTGHKDTTVSAFRRIPVSVIVWTCRSERNGVSDDASTCYELRVTLKRRACAPHLRPPCTPPRDVTPRPRLAFRLRAGSRDASRNTRSDSATNIIYLWNVIIKPLILLSNCSYGKTSRKQNNNNVPWWKRYAISTYSIQI